MTLGELQARVGQELGVSAWFPITQDRVDAFAAATDDPDWMHIDVERARRGPIGGTIGQGFLTLSLLLRFSHELGYWPANTAYALNYGLDRVRWVAPVRVGSRVRTRVRLVSIEPRGAESWLVTTEHTVEIEGEARPAMVATWLGLMTLEPAA